MTNVVPKRSKRSRRPLGPHDYAFLADRLASWRPHQNVEQITCELSQLSEDDYWKLFRETFKLNTSHNIKFATTLLAKHGWFIDLEVPPPSAVAIAELMQTEKEQEAHAALENYFEDRRHTIKSELEKRFPHRARFLENGFRFHDAGDYNTSVPLFLIQADGICHDVFRDDLFRVKHAALRVRKKVDGKKVNWLWDAVAEPLRELLPIATHETPGNGKFNRHLILHGADLEYGVRRNSLRAISLLSYLQGMAELEEGSKIVSE